MYLQWLKPDGNACGSGRATKPQKSFKVNVLAGHPTQIVSKDALDALCKL